MVSVWFCFQFITTERIIENPERIGALSNILKRQNKLGECIIFTIQNTAQPYYGATMTDLSPDFQAYFESTLKPRLQSLEKDRLRLLEVQKKAPSRAGLIAVAITVVAALVIREVNERFYLGIFGISSMLGLVTFLLVGKELKKAMLHQAGFTDFRRRYKNNIANGICSYFCEPGYQYDDESRLSETDIQASGLFPEEQLRGNGQILKSGKDLLTGRIANKPVRLCEYKLIRRVRQGNSTRKSILFHGLAVEISGLALPPGELYLIPAGREKGFHLGEMIVFNREGLETREVKRRNLATVMKHMQGEWRWQPPFDAPELKAVTGLEEIFGERFQAMAEHPHEALRWFRHPAWRAWLGTRQDERALQDEMIDNKGKQGFIQKVDSELAPKASHRLPSFSVRNGKLYLAAPLANTLSKMFESNFLEPDLKRPMTGISAVAPSAMEFQRLQNLIEGLSQPDPH